MAAKTGKKGGTAKKSSHKKSKKIVRGEKRVVPVDAKKKYEIAEIGPVHLSWGKKRVKNSKGRYVKQWYLKKDSKHLIWVKWVQPFEDEVEKDDDYWTKWSAEEQSVLCAEGSELKKQVTKVLEEKVVWPWVSNDDDASGKRLEILKSGRYKEWKAKTKADGKGAKWNLKNQITVSTESEGTDSESDSTSATDDGADEEEEEDEV